MMLASRLFTCSFAAILLFVAAFSAHASNYTPLVQRGTTDYRAKFAPTSESLAIADGEVIIPSVVGESYDTKWRVFVPPGTKTLQVTLYTFASPPETKVLMRFGTPPVGNALNVTPESAATVDITRVVQALTANGGGAELSFYAPASAGSVKLSSRSSDITQTILTQQGGWVYINGVQLPGNRVYELNTSVTVDEACYRSWYASANWDASGNPVEDAVHTCSGSTGGTVLTGISLNGSSLTKGSTATLTITPTPSNASLSSCSAVSGGIATNLVAINGSSISLGAGASTIASAQTVTIQCGTSVSATLTVLPSAVALSSITLSTHTLMANDTTTNVVVTPNAGATLPSCVAMDPGSPPFVPPYESTLVAFTGSSFKLTSLAAAAVKTTKKELTITCGSVSAATSFTIDVPLQIEDRKEADGTLTLAFNFRPDGFTVPVDARLWVIGFAPKNPILGVAADTYLYRTEAGKWDLLYQSFDLDKLAFKHYSAVQSTQEVTIPTGVRKGDLNMLSVEVHFFYQLSDGTVRYLGKIFPHS